MKMTGDNPARFSDADRNWHRFVAFRVLFNARFYYPVLAIFFLDLGLSATEYTLLNFAWAIAIVLTDLPAGVLADRIGRKPLVVAAAVCMVLEMALLTLAPRNGGLVLLLCCLANRILSGMAEGMASGADEALVFDSLAERGRASEWPHVLDMVMRWQGIGMVIAVLTGGAVYDPHVMTRLLSFFGSSLTLDQGTTLRFPIYLNLITALIILAIALGLREPAVRATHVAPENTDTSGPELTAWHLALQAGRWILQTPVALFVITAGVLCDSVARLFVTFASSYYRLVSVPESAFGIIGAAMGGLGLLVSPVARRMALANTVARNFTLIGLNVLLGLVIAACHPPYWGALAIIPLMSSLMALGYLVSYYLNALTDSAHRATVLSFKGLVFNIGYGFISLLFALALKAAHDGASPEQAVAHGLLFLPFWIILGALLVFACFHRHRLQLHAVIRARESK